MIIDTDDTDDTDDNKMTILMMMMITTKIIGLDENNENTDDHRVIKRRGEA